MYTVLTKEGVGLPTVMSQNNIHYPDFINNGYEIVYTGTKKECNEIADEMICAFCD